MNDWLGYVLPASVFILTAVTAYFGLPWLRRLHVGQQVREDGPRSHFKKNGTPTFGGLFFLLPLAWSMLIHLSIVRKFGNYEAVSLLMLLFAAVGFADDFIKVRINKNGLSVRQKVFWLGLASFLFSAWYLWLSPLQPIFVLPLSGKALPISGSFKYLYLLLTVAYLFYISNSVNLSDGVDGLCSSLSLVCAGLFVPVLGILAKRGQAPDASGLQWVALSIAAGCAGFLIYNWHPARVFMGDTGSQALGVGLAAIALLAGVPWLMLFHGLVFILEGLSTLLQVAYFKLSHGKRIFRMAPIHHHFELSGWSELKIVLIFVLTGILGGLIGLALI